MLKTALLIVALVAQVLAQQTVYVDPLNPGRVRSVPLAQSAPGTGDVSTTSTNVMTGYTNFSGGSFRFPEKTVATLPSAASNTSKIYRVTDGVSAQDCTVGGGSTSSTCYSNGSAWISMFSISVTTPLVLTGTGLSCPTCGDASTNTSSSVDSEVAIFSSTGGKTFKRATQTGVAKLTSGVLGVVSGTSTNCVLVDGTSAACGSGGGMADPGSDGMVARTALNTTAARTMSGSDSTVLWTNGNGKLGNPDATVNPALVLLRSTDQSGANRSCVSASASDDYKCDMTPVLAAYSTRMVVEFTPTAVGNTGAAKLEINTLGSGTGKDIKLCDGTTDPATGDIAVGKQVALRYDGTVFRLPCNPATVTGADPNTVTAAGTLTSNAPVIGAGSKAASVGSRSGNTTEFATINGTKTTGKQLRFDASGNIEASSSDIGGGASTETGPIPFEPFGVASNGDAAGVLSAKRVIYLPFVARSSAPLTTATFFSYDTTNKYIAAGIYSVGSGSCSLLVQTDTANVSTASTLTTVTFASAVPLVTGRLYFLGITADATGFNWLLAHGINGAKLAQVWNVGLSASDYIYFYDDTVSTGTTTLTMPSACSGTRNAGSIYSQIWTFLK